MEPPSRPTTPYTWRADLREPSSSARTRLTRYAALGVAAADREDEQPVAGSRGASPASQAAKRRVPALVVDARGQLGDVVGRRVRLEAAQLAEVVDGVAAWPAEPPTPRMNSRPPPSRTAAKPGRDGLDRVAVELGDDPRGLVAGSVSAKLVTSRLRRDAAHRERVEAELVPVAADVARQEAGPHEQRPQVARVVVALVVVHLLGRADAEPERGELERALAAPRRDVDEHDAARGGDAAQLAQRLAGLPQVLEHRQAERDVERRRLAASAARRASEPSIAVTFGCASRSSASARSTSTAERDGVELRAREARLEAAAEVAEARVRRSSACRRTATRAQPHAEAVDRRLGAVLTVGAGAARRASALDDEAMAVEVVQDQAVVAHALLVDELA